ncbi:hypothetical protein EG349_04370 [Chryseobacterium shandongense]|uniref:Uncharacterized protein n=1 Tax=Chryseobacterium shandongense TaxID=1493872 RepID=A0A3G6Q0C0_9FLAO|nr:MULTISPECIES: hypothetical protein [Chryseobacterium]AZA57831.1 hypothetical protein EG350_11840 [Chryseobacterium shandongense]AZA86071.1 hypothetical protein EG349_04370 [Chryseobacterium shandongense]AZA94479.1 hypothetical protein EG353_02395 [Chryseobacterium shandongense]
MSYTIKTTREGLIYIKASCIIKVSKPNSIEGAKVAGGPLIINADLITFLSYDTESKVTYFMMNGFQISMKIMFQEAEEALQHARLRLDKIIKD